MNQLDIRFYSRAEIAEVLSLNIKSSNFARDVRETLKNWGYGFEYIKREGVMVLSKPETPEERLRELLIKVFDMDIQIEAFQFACFIFAFSDIEGFDSMPWEERQRLLKTEYCISVSEKTLRNWCHRLIKSGVIGKSNMGQSSWCTYYDRGEKCRDQVEDDDEFMQQYFERRNELIQSNYKSLLESGKSQKEARSEAWAVSIKMLWAEFQCCYYKCKSFNLGAFSSEKNEALQEIYELADIIMTTNHTSIAPQKTA